MLAAAGAATPPTSLDALAWGGTPVSVDLPPPVPLFPRIDKKAYLAEIEPVALAEDAPPPAAVPPPAPARPTPPTHEGKPMIDIDQFASVELKVGTVLAAERVPKSNKLIKLQVDLGAETRQVVAGIGREYTPEDLPGKQVILVANLAPATLMGVESQGMVLAASVDGAPCLLQPATPVPPGTPVK